MVGNETKTKALQYDARSWRNEEGIIKGGALETLECGVQGDMSGEASETLKLMWKVRGCLDPWVTRD
jgi:hypothetical protein